MKIEFIERNGDKASQRLKKVLTDKVNKLGKYFDEDAAAKVICMKQNKLEKLEVTIKSKSSLYRGEVSSANMYDNIDLALPKLEKQIVRAVEKNKKKPRGKGVKTLEVVPFEFLQEQPEELPEVIKKKSFDLAPITVDDARYEIERVGHDFYIFLNARTGRVNVMYRRKDGKLGLIDLHY